MKQSKFIAQTYIPAALVRAVSRQVGGWKELCRIAEDVATNGANVGWSGFIYYADTVPFFHRNRAAILELLKRNAIAYGYDSEMHLVFHFKGLLALQGDIAFALYAAKLKQLFDDTAIPNAVAWYVLEEVAQAVNDFASWED